VTARERAAQLEALVAAAIVAAETCDPSDPAERGRAAAALLDCQNALAVQFLPLARKVAGQVLRHYPLVDADELTDECGVGVVKASRSWEPGRGNSFLTHAYVGAWRYGLSWAARQNKRGFTWLPRHLSPGLVSVCGPDAEPVVGTLTAPEAAAPDLTAGEWAALFAGMPERLRRVLRLRHEDGLTLREVAAELGVSHERSRQLQSKAIAWLWEHKGRFLTGMANE